MKRVRWGATSGNPNTHPRSMITYVGVEYRLDLSVLGQLAQVPVPVQERLGTVQDLHVGPNNKPSLCFVYLSLLVLFELHRQNEEGKRQQAAF